MYAKFWKRFIDIVLSLSALIVLFPLLLLLTVIGVATMKGNPFFTQKRPGMIDKVTGEEKIFTLIKFRTMSNAKDENGNLLPDDVRLNSYGKILRATSLDELPELFNIFIGDMSIVGPRPLLVKYLPYYTDAERIRHTIRPGLTGYAQVKGRNTLSWEERFEMDSWYVSHMSLKNDIIVIIDTVKAVLHHDGIVLNALEDFDEYRKNADTKTQTIQ